VTGKLELACENFNCKRNFIKYEFQRCILSFPSFTPANGGRSKRKKNEKLKEWKVRENKLIQKLNYDQLLCLIPTSSSSSLLFPCKCYLLTCLITKNLGCRMLQNLFY